MRGPKNAVRPGLTIEPGHGVEVLEKNTDTSWALFHTLLDQQQRGFVETAPGGPDAARDAGKPVAITLDAALVMIRRNNRVCPLPSIWKQLYDALPDKSPQLATVPLTSQEWKQTPALQKRTRLREHIEWAAAHGVLNDVYTLLDALPENKWQHMGE
jgi:hypothetical protein